MKAAVLYAPNSPLEIEDLTLVRPHHGDVLVRLAASGVCSLDWHVISGDTKHPMPVVVGHEGAGVVEAVGENVTTLSTGDKVVLNWAPIYGECYYCLHVRPNLYQTLVGPLWQCTLMDGTSRLSKNRDVIYHLSGLSTFSEKAVSHRKRVSPSVKISHSSTYHLEEINTAFDDMVSREAARGVILFD